jgi:hypothetical protein
MNGIYILTDSPEVVFGEKNHTSQKANLTTKYHVNAQMLRRVDMKKEPLKIYDVTLSLMNCLHFTKNVKNHVTQFGRRSLIDQY